jgi:hypothetical protein
VKRYKGVQREETEKVTEGRDSKRNNRKETEGRDRGGEIRCFET